MISCVFFNALVYFLSIFQADLLGEHCRYLLPHMYSNDPVKERVVCVSGFVCAVTNRPGDGQANYPTVTL